MKHAIQKNTLREWVGARNFRQLFIALGWDTERVSSELLSLRVGEREYMAKRVAEKRGFVVCVCDAGKDYPANQNERRRLSSRLRLHHYEHLLILCGEGKQCWSVGVRPQNQPLRTVEVEWYENQDIDFLREKLDGMIFGIAEEDGLSIVDVVERVRNAFMENAGKVANEFYDKFRNELSEFTKFIAGISEQVSKEWYAALMLNRLMFIYFIQKRHFLNGETHYLENRLKDTQKQLGDDEFYGFYREFLRRLFSKGLGAPASERSPQINKLLGKVPYLNGGLFDLHEIERENADIKIPDCAFEKLFAFFDQYNWHLDTRPLATGTDINPDVIGYIFEKYINKRAEMGAYYTQEDVTGYIARNTIIPYLLHRAKEKRKNAFDADNGIWRFLRENPDAYIYDSVKKGCEIPDEEIPANIRRGIDAAAPDLRTRRKDWNTKADARFALTTENGRETTEIWRETIARRERYFALKKKIEKGEIHEIDDLITHNLDIEKFAANALSHYEDPNFVIAFFEAIDGKKNYKNADGNPILRSNEREKRGITVLDPACGSGAFLFAALNILKPLYKNCIEQIQVFVNAADNPRAQHVRMGKEKRKYFRGVLADIAEHQNEDYWIYKTIILNNLYGVDLMKEAAEIAKLRLFLKLAAEAEYDPDKDNLGLEPLPDIDFNIRAGNSLVGFATLGQLKHYGQGKIDFDDRMKRIVEDAEAVRDANRAFKEAQDFGGPNYREAKEKLRKRLAKLNRTMHGYLAAQYGKRGNTPEYAAWLQSHQPFHWLAEFYGIIEDDGGFDVVIGNPPYVRYSEKSAGYAVRQYKTAPCKNLYTFFMERSKHLINRKSRFGMIVPISLVSAKNMKEARNLYLKDSVWVSTFADRPSTLFRGVHQIPSICITAPATKGAHHWSAGFHHWLVAERGHLFDTLAYTESTILENQIWRKISTPLESSIFEKIRKHKNPISFYFQTNGALVSICGGTGGYWLRAFNAAVNSSEYKKVFVERDFSLPLCALLNSSLFHWLWRKVSNCRHLRKEDMNEFFIELHPRTVASLTPLGKKHLTALKATKEHRGGGLSYEQYRPAKAKREVDAIDLELARVYNLTEAELDHIINYDIKYRMGLHK